MNTHRNIKTGRGNVHPRSTIADSRAPPASANSDGVFRGTSRRLQCPLEAPTLSSSALSLPRRSPCVAPPNVVLFSPSLGCESPALPVKAGVYSNFGCQVNQYKSAMPDTVKHSGLYVTFITVQSDCLYLGSTYF